MAEQENYMRQLYVLGGIFGKLPHEVEEMRTDYFAWSLTFAKADNDAARGR